MLGSSVLPSQWRIPGPRCWVTTSASWLQGSSAPSHSPLSQGALCDHYLIVGHSSQPPLWHRVLERGPGITLSPSAISSSVLPGHVITRAASIVSHLQDPGVTRFQRGWNEEQSQPLLPSSHLCAPTQLPPSSFQQAAMALAASGMTTRSSPFARPSCSWLSETATCLTGSTQAPRKVHVIGKSTFNASCTDDLELWALAGRAACCFARREEKKQYLSVFSVAIAKYPKQGITERYQS